MNKFLLINVSPRQKGTSVILAQACREFLQSKGHHVTLMHLYPNLDEPEKIYRAVDEADTIVLSGPSYINTYPADTVALLEGLVEHPEVLHGQKLYGMIQGGMPYAHTHESGLSLLDMFARKCDISYSGGFVMGMGAMLNGQPIEKLLNSNKVIRQLNVFFGHVEKGEISPREVYLAAQLKLPGFVTGLMARYLNRNIDKELKRHGITVGQRSPYWEMQ